MASVTYIVKLGAYPCQFYFTETSDREAMEKEIEHKVKIQEKKTKEGVLD